MGCFPLAVLFLVQLITLQDWGKACAWVDGHTAAVFFTWLLLLGVEGLVVVLTGRFFPAAVVVTLPTVLFAVANHLKEARNGEPSLASDLVLAGHAGELTSFLRPGMEQGHVGKAQGLA